jgi:FKBP-type peptidyl-prolyl cis-trans isomerase
VRGGKKESSALPVEDRLALQALGHAIGREKSDLSVLDASELDEVFAGVKAELLGEQSHVDFQSYAPKGVDILVDKWEALAEKTFQEGKEALERAVAEPGAKQTESGLVVQTLVEGVGDSPTLDQAVEIHLAGSLVDGTSIFTSTKEVGAPLVFEVGKLTKGLCEGLQLMKPGSKVKFTIPHELAYGDRYIPPNIPPKAVLVFHVELLDVK